MSSTPGGFILNKLLILMISRFRGANERWKIKFFMNVILRSNFSRVIYK